MEIDSAIIARAASGDHKAFEIVVRACQSRVHALAWRMTFDKNEAEDLTQEVFIHLYRNLHKYNTNHEFQPWLYRVSANYMINRLKKKRMGTTSLDAVFAKGGIAGKSPAPLENIELGEEIAQLRAAMADLSDDYKSMIALKYDEDLSITEISGITGISEANVKIRLFRAREQLRKKLEKPVTKPGEKS